MRSHSLLYLFCLAAIAVPAACQNGVWLPAQLPENGLGGWWELRADGSATYNWGAFAEARYTFDGTLLTVIPGANRKDRPRFQLRFAADRMYSRADETGAPETEYRRSGPVAPVPAAAGAPGAPLLGQWVSVPPAKAAMPAMADMPGMTGAPRDMPSVRTFTSDGLYQVRILYTVRQGRWDASSRTIRLDGEPEQTFALKNGVLTVAGVAFRPN